MDAIPIRESRGQDHLVCKCAGVSRAPIRAAIATTPAPALASLGRPLVHGMPGQSPWCEVANAKGTTLARDRRPQRAIVRRLAGLARGPSDARALASQHVVLTGWIDETRLARTSVGVYQSADANRFGTPLCRPYCRWRSGRHQSRDRHRRDGPHGSVLTARSGSNFEPEPSHHRRDPFAPLQAPSRGATVFHP